MTRRAFAAALLHLAVLLPAPSVPEVHLHPVLIRYGVVGADGDVFMPGSFTDTLELRRIDGRP